MIAENTKQVPAGTRGDIKVFAWCIRLAWKMNPLVLTGWLIASALIALLPAASLVWQKNILSTLTGFLTTGTGKPEDLIGSLTILGGILILIGITGRLQTGFFGSVLGEYYYNGWCEIFMELIQDVEMKTLNRKDIWDEYAYVKYQPDALSGLLINFLILIRQGVSIISLLGLSLTYSPVITGATFIYLAAVLTINQKLTGKRTYDYVKDREYLRRTEYYEKTVMQPGVAKELRIFHNADRMQREWEEAYRPIYLRDLKIAKWRSLISFFCGTGYYLLMILLLVYSIFRLQSGALTVDVFLVLYAMAQSMSSIIQDFSGTFHNFKKGLYLMRRKMNFVLTVPRKERREETSAKPADAPIVFEAKDLCFSYDDKKEVLHHLNFRIKKGETVALVGLNGSGKSTLVKLLIEQYQPTRGELFFCGIPYKNFARETIARNIGMFFQDFTLFHATLQENVGFGDVAHIHEEERVLGAMKKGGALGLLDQLPDGLKTWLIKKVKKDAVNFSGGEKQKVAVSRAHMSDKEVMIFDEPASALDPIAEMEQFAAIREKVRGRTAILISHRVGFARLADRILVLDDGNLAEEGTHEELIAKNGIYAAFFRTQASWYDVEKKETSAYADTREASI